MFMRTMTLIIGFFFSISNYAQANELKCIASNKLPSVLSGCQGEGCSVLSYPKALKDITTFKKMDVTSKKIFTVKRCDVLKDFKALTLLKKFGSAKILEDFSPLKKDQIYPILFHHGEGFHAICVNNKLMDATVTGDDGFPLISVLNQTESETWISLKGPDGSIGYVQDGDFYEGHYDNYSARYCPEEHPFGKEQKILEDTLIKNIESTLNTSCSNDSIKMEVLQKKINEQLKMAKIKGYTCDTPLAKKPCSSQIENNLYCKVDFSDGSKQTPIMIYKLKCLKSDTYKCTLSY